MKKVKALDQITAKDFAGLQMDQLQRIRTGNITIEQIVWFNKLSFEQREELLKSFSQKFERTNFVVSVFPSGKNFTINPLISELLPTKYENGVLDYLDPDIINWFGSVNFLDTEPESGRVYLFKNSLTNNDIITEGKNLGIYKEYSIGHALLLVKSLLKVGVINKNRNREGVVIYLKEKRHTFPCRLSVYLGLEGELRTRISCVDPLHLWNSKHGVLFCE